MKKKFCKAIVILLVIALVMPMGVVVSGYNGSYEAEEAEEGTMCEENANQVTVEYLIERFDVYRNYSSGVRWSYYSFRLVEGVYMSSEGHEGIWAFSARLGMFHAATLEDIINFVDPDLIVYIRPNFNTDGTIELDPNDFELPEDVSLDDWFLRYIMLGIRFEIIQGVSQDGFLVEPERGITRAEFITMLGRLHEYGNETIGTPGEGLFYDRYLNWAVEMGIMHGDQNGELMPYSFLTREQMFVIVYRYINAFDLWWYFRYSHIAPMLTSDMVRGISPWAEHAIVRLYDVNLMSSANPPIGGALRPQDVTARADALRTLIRIGVAMYENIHPFRFLDD